jgi:hypothetical protein
MKLTKVMMCIPVIALASATAGAQVVADLVAAPEIPAGSAFAPHTPAGVAIVGTNIWVGDAAQGFRHYVPVDPNDTDPINTGQLKFDIDPNFSVGGGSCFLFCSVGQVAQDGNARVYIAVYDHAKGQPFAPAGGGVYMLPFLSTFTFGAFEGLNTVAPGLGLNADQPTALALGPDGKLYVGFLKNGNIKRVTNPSQINPTPQTQTVESVGTTPNGRNMRAMAFLGPDLYIATDQGLSVVRNVATCIGNQGGCDNAVVVQDGHVGAAHVGLTGDGASKLYFSVAGSVFRYTPATNSVVPVSGGFLFVDGHTNTLSLDAFGNLWIGDDPSDGAFNFSGMLWRIPAARLASIP